MFVLKDINLKYLKIAPNLYLKIAQLQFSSMSLNINSTDVKILNNKIKEITAKIDNFEQDKIVMSFQLDVESNIEDQIKLASSHYKLIIILSIKGFVDIKLNFTVPVL